MKIIIEAIKVTKGKLKGSDFFIKKKNLMNVEKRISKIMEEERFRNFKSIVETGAAAGSVFVIVAQFYDPLATIASIDDLKNSIDSLKNEVSHVLTKHGLKVDQMDTRVVELEKAVSKIEELSSSNEDKDFIIKKLEEENKRLAISNKITNYGFIGLGFVVIFSMFIGSAQGFEVAHKIISSC